jgi:hypothetical protein
MLELSWTRQKRAAVPDPCHEAIRAREVALRHMQSVANEPRPVIRQSKSPGHVRDRTMTVKARVVESVQSVLFQDRLVDRDRGLGIGIVVDRDHDHVRLV